MSVRAESSQRVTSTVSSSGEDQVSVPLTVTGPQRMIFAGIAPPLFERIAIAFSNVRTGESGEAPLPSAAAVPSR